MVSNVRFTPAPDHLVPTGLLGWASFLIDGQVRISGVSVRRTQRGKLTLSYPIKDDGYGQRWPYVQPINDAARVDLERQVLSALKSDSRAECKFEADHFGSSHKRNPQRSNHERSSITPDPER